SRPSQERAILPLNPKREQEVSAYAPKPPSRNSLFLWHLAFLERKAKCQRHIEVFGKGFGEEPFYKKVLPVLLS
ncbi:MAG: hypothetical protein AB1473_19935, partial [Thermodesulfobacteriota bacterium]